MPTDAPAPDVIEVSIFGPGKGESVVVHLGYGNWIIVDSCIDQLDRTVPALGYLERIGVDVGRDVRMVVGTHAHDDHFAGISQVLQACTSAVFVCSAAATTEEYCALIELDERQQSFLRASALNEYRKIHEIVKLRGRANRGLKPLKYAMELKPLLTVRTEGGPPATVIALSPSDEAITRSRVAFAKEYPSIGERRRAPSVDPNELAIALWVEVGDKVLLLGADLLNGPAGCGWGAVLATLQIDRGASLFKGSPPWGAQCSRR